MFVAVMTLCVTVMLSMAIGHAVASFDTNIEGVKKIALSSARLGYYAGTNGFTWESVSNSCEATFAQVIANKK